jgi:hypothetical protein
MKNVKVISNNEGRSSQLKIVALNEKTGISSCIHKLEIKKDPKRELLGAPGHKQSKRRVELPILVDLDRR